jgi:hypothetical protein
MRRYTFFRIILLLSVAGIVSVLYAGDDSLLPQVGIVVELSAPSDRYQLSREQDGMRVKKEVKLLMPLYEYDILWMSCIDTDKERSSGSTYERIRMTIQVADGAKEITCEDSPYTLTKQEPCSVLSNFTGSLKETVLSLYKGLHDQYQTQLISLVVRGDQGSLFMPLIGQSGARLAAGVRDLNLSWIGGYPPYVLRINAEGAEKPLIELNLLKERRVHIKGLSLKADNYKLELKDARNQQLTRHFQAVALDQIPELKQQMFGEVRNPIDEKLRETIYAAWLSEQDPLMWSLEAYQRVVGIASNFYPAELLRLRLEGKL